MRLLRVNYLEWIFPEQIFEQVASGLDFGGDSQKKSRRPVLLI